MARKHIVLAWVLGAAVLLYGCNEDSSATGTDDSGTGTTEQGSDANEQPYSSTSDISGKSSSSVEGGSSSQSVAPALTYRQDTTTDIVNDVKNRKYEGVTHITGFHYADSTHDITVSEMSFKYVLGSFFGEPITKAIFMWSGSSGKQGVSTITLLSKVFNLNGTFTGYYFSYSPMVEDEDGKWSWDVSGSPDWNKFLWADTKGETFAPKADVVSLYNAGFYMGETVVTEINLVKLSVK